MPYYLFFYALPENAQPPAGMMPEDVPRFIRAHAKPVGEIEFSAGESTLFLGALGDLTGVNTYALEDGSIHGVEPDEDSNYFGGLSRASAEKLIHAIDALGPDLSKSSPATGKSLKAVAAQFRIPERQFQAVTLRIRDLLQRALAPGYEPATIYE